MSASTIANSYRDEALFVDLPSDLTCTICLGGLRKPVELPCSHAFCQACLPAGSCTACPNCRAPIPAISETSGLLERLVLNLKVRCTRGCGWSGALRDIDSHASLCSGIDIESDGGADGEGAGASCSRATSGSDVGAAAAAAVQKLRQQLERQSAALERATADAQAHARARRAERELRSRRIRALERALQEHQQREHERLERKRRVRERREQERLEQERLEQERREQKRREQKRRERRERREQERLEQERLEQERRERREREEASLPENIDTGAVCFSCDYLTWHHKLGSCLNRDCEKYQRMRECRRCGDDTWDNDERNCRSWRCPLNETKLQQIMDFARSLDLSL